MRTAKSLTLLLILVSLILSACSPQNAAVHNPTASDQPVNDPPVTGATAVVDAQTTPNESQPLPTVVQGADDQPAGQDAAESSPTPDLRLPPDRWKEWEVTPQISARAIQIYREGLARGNDPMHFSVVGDCQSIREVFMGDYDHAALYHLDGAHAYLQETIDFYSGNFDRSGMAVRGGFTAASLLSPLHADPEYCDTGETPLGCEFRLHKPSIVIISLETWADYQTIERYEVYLRKIVDASLAAGVLPVLMTKADVAEVGDGRHYINPAVARVAYEYDLPLANFWRSAQTLENWGIDPERDGFHLSEDGFRRKSFVALQALDAVRRAVLGEAPAQQEDGLVANTTPTVESEVEPAAQWAAPSLCAQGSGCVLIGVNATDDEQQRGVWLAEPEGGESEKLALPLAELQHAVGRSALISSGGNLYRLDLDGSQPRLLAQDLLPGDGLRAVIRPDGGVVYLSADERGAGLPLIAAQGTHTLLATVQDAPQGLIPSTDASRQYVKTAAGVAFVALETGAVEPVGGMLQPAFSPDGAQVAFMDPQYNTENGFNDKLAIEDLQKGLVSRRLVIFPPSEGYMVRNRLYQFTWSPNGGSVLALMADHSNYFEKVMVYHAYVFTLNNGWLKEYARLNGVLPAVAWSPDGTSLMIGQTLEEAGSYRLEFQHLNLDGSKPAAAGFDTVGSAGQAFVYITRMAWLGGE